MLRLEGIPHTDGEDGALVLESDILTMLDKLYATLGWIEGWAQ